MALSVPKSVFQNMMKDGSKHYKGLEEAVYRNIDACKELTETTRSSYGPNGMNKMVINHLDKLFVTNDAATILKELEVQHPAAKMLVFASNMQEQEVGDGTNLVMMFAGALLHHAEELLKMGLAPAEIVEGYELAIKKALELLPSLVCGEIEDMRDVKQVVKYMKSAITSKQYGNEDFLTQLLAEACISIMPQNGNFNVDNVRVSKILGSGIHASEIIQGMVFRREVEGNLNKVKDAKMAVFSCPLDALVTETKGTVLIKNADELMNFNKGEENLLEAQIRAIADAGCNVIVCGGKTADMAIHFCNKYNIMVVRLMSKFDLRRLCRACQATALPKLMTPTPEQTGHCDQVFISEIGDSAVVIFKQEREDSAVATVVVRGSTLNIMDDMERSVDDGVNCYKALNRDARVLPGAGATEIQLSLQMRQYGQTISGLEQYAVKKFGEALECVPRAMADNAGVKGTELVSNLYAAHDAGNKTHGFDIEGEGAATCDAVAKNIFDSYLVKYWALKFATNAAVTVLRVDQIIMAKAAGGPKPKENKNWDED